MRNKAYASFGPNTHNIESRTHFPVSRHGEAGRAKRAAGIPKSSLGRWAVLRLRSPECKEFIA
jgi:hypothetical protein